MGWGDSPERPGQHTRAVEAAPSPLSGLGHTLSLLSLVTAQLSSAPFSE